MLRTVIAHLLSPDKEFPPIPFWFLKYVVIYDEAMYPSGSAHGLVV